MKNTSYCLSAEMSISSSCSRKRLNVSYPTRESNLERDYYIVQEIYKGRRIGEIAKELRLSRQRISQIYHFLEGNSKSIRDLRIESFWTLDKKALLGTRPDIELASTWSISENSVRERRNALGVPRYCQKAPRNNRVGEDHNSLKIIKFVYDGESRSYKYVCLCKRCGKKTKPLSYGNIKRTKSCGCALIEYWSLKVRGPNKRSKRSV